MAKIRAVSEPNSIKKQMHRQTHLRTDECFLRSARRSILSQILSKKQRGIFIIKAMASPKVMGAVISINRDINALIGEKFIISKSAKATIASVESLRKNLLSPIFRSKIYIIIYRSVDGGKGIYSPSVLD